jgi:hypothetical protein
MVTVEVASPVATSRLLVTVTLQATAWPPTLSVPLHWLTTPGAVAAPAFAWGHIHISAIASSRAAVRAAPFVRADLGSVAARAATGSVVMRHRSFVSAIVRERPSPRRYRTVTAL